MGGGVAERQAGRQRERGRGREAERQAAAWPAVHWWSDVTPMHRVYLQCSGSRALRGAVASSDSTAQKNWRGLQGEACVPSTSPLSLRPQRPPTITPVVLLRGTPLNTISLVLNATLIAVVPVGFCLEVRLPMSLMCMRAGR